MRFLPSEDHLLLRIRRDLSRNLVPKDVNITPQQLAAVKNVPPLGGLTMSDADKQSLQQLWNSWATTNDASAKVEADKKILAAVNEISGRSLEATKVTAADRGKQIKAILSKEQI